jgi:hypothetical protein
VGGGQQHHRRHQRGTGRQRDRARGACSTGWATLPVTDIAVATISHAQKNRAALRLPAPKPPSGSSPEVIGMVLQEALRVTVASYGRAHPQRLSAIDSLVLRRPAVVQ